MRKLFITLAIVLAGTGALLAQEKEYGQIVGTFYVSSRDCPRVAIQLEDKGDLTKKTYLADENGKMKFFRSFIDAMNYMSKLGWTLESTYVIPGEYHNGVHHQFDAYWVISRPAGGEKLNTIDHK